MNESNAIWATLSFWLLLTTIRFLIINPGNAAVGFTISFTAYFFYHAIPKK